MSAFNTKLDIKNVEELVNKFDQLKKQNPLDLSSDQDLSFAIMNLISIEEHLIFSGAKTGKAKYYDLIEPIREVRKELLKTIIKDHEGEVWCISKHLLATVMRLMEVGTKQLSLNNKNEAYEFFQKAYDLYSLFWGLNMNLITGESSSEDESSGGASDNAIESISENKQALPRKKRFGVLGKIVQKIIDCCIE